MEDTPPCWLPKLLLLDNFQGDWERYLHSLYHCFYRDFIDSRPHFEHLPIFVRYHPAHQQKGATFWHLISEGAEESERTPDFRRCERICWPRPLIEQTNDEEVRVWETIRPWKNQQQRRINFGLNDFSYIVVIAETRRGFDLVTAYYVDRASRREKLKRECDAFIRQKKEGSAIQAGPKLLLRMVDE